MNRGRRSELGFTIVEVVVTLVVTSLFLAFFFQMYLMGESQRLVLARQSTASNIAYANLRKITARDDVVAIAPCNSTTDLTANSTAPGTAITSLITPESTTNSGLNGTITQTIKAYYPKGCGSNMPIKIEATTSYGSPQESVVHATYIN